MDTSPVIFREATTEDITGMQVVRHLVKENVLSNPALVTDEDCRQFITEKGKGWVCEVDGSIVGFSIVDLRDNNIWALFVNPDFEGMGIGKRLHALMLEWYFSQTTSKVWLGTSPNTRAEKFYRLYGWKDAGMNGNEIKFELAYEDWKNLLQSTIKK